MSTITAIIIYKKADDNLEKCLKTVHQIADEIIILDIIKSDDVKVKCREYSYKYLPVDSEGKKESLLKAVKSVQQDYILFLNSNECFSGQLKQSLLGSHKNFDFDAYRFNVLKNYYGQWMKHSGLYPDFQIRLMKKQAGCYINGEIEKIKIPGGKIKITSSPGDLFCMQYSNIREHIQTLNDATETEAKILCEEGVKTNIFKMVFVPFGHFLNLFFIKLGFLDGFYGMINAVISGYSDFLKHVKLRELHRMKNNK